MSDIEHNKKVLMTRRVAERWLRAVSFPEYRVRVLYGSREIRNLTSLLYSMRDGKIAMRGISRVADLGVKESADGLELWSKDREGLVALANWFEKRGFETSDTSGIW